MPSAVGGRPGLDREAILAAALTVLDEVGLDALTTRRIADRLRVRQPALYWHFRSKRALVDAMAARMMADRADVASAPDDWRRWLADDARSFRRCLLSYRDGARLHTASTPDGTQFPELEAHARVLCNAGFSPANALRALIAAGRYALGCALEEQSSVDDEGVTEEDRGAQPIRGPFPLLARAIAEISEGDADATFEAGLAALIKGFESVLAGEGSSIR